MLAIGSLLAAVIPMISYLLIIWRLDKYEREPLEFIFRHFLWGAVGAVLLSFIGNSILYIFLSLFIGDSVMLELGEAVFIAPVVEELMKGIVLLVTVRSLKFDNMTDGMVYGGAIGLGFGMTENFIYFIGYGDSLTSWLVLVFIRSGFSAVMHCIATASFGAMLGAAKNSSGNTRVIFPLIGILIAMFMHFMWNLTVSFESTFFLGFVFMFFVILFFTVLFYVSISNEKKMIREELLEESAINIIPAHHVDILSSSERMKKGWVKEQIRKEYVRSAIKLAFRKMQAKRQNLEKSEIYFMEIKKYRDRVIKLLNSESNSKIT